MVQSMQQAQTQQQQDQEGSCERYARALLPLPEPALFKISAQVGMTLPPASTTDWLKLETVKVECHR